MKKNELIALMREAQAEYNAAETAEAREAAEIKYNKAKREHDILDAEERDAASQQKPDKNAIIREMLQGVRTDKTQREITLGTTQAKGQILDSGAVMLTIRDIIPTLNEGLGLPLTVVTGVAGEELYPVSVDDAEVEEVGETAALTDQDINFDNIRVKSARCGISIVVSNTAIDNADFDLLGFIQQKMTLAVKKYLAKKVYSQAAFTGNKGPFSGLSSAGTITLASDNVYEKILTAVAQFTDKGFDAAKVCLVMDATTEATLKATKRGDNTSAYVIQDGKCAGYDYVVSHYINTKLHTDNKTLVPTDDKFIAIGYFDFLAVQQHGPVRLVIDATSKQVAVKNVTAVVLNTAFSLTDLSVKLNKKGGTTTQAFALYKLA